MVDIPATYSHTSFLDIGCWVLGVGYSQNRKRDSQSIRFFEDEDDAASLILDPTGPAQPGQRPHWSETPHVGFCGKRF
jgi:hypothetical protein